MKVLSIKQPWATLIMEGHKRFEFRTWQTKYRGDILIHASKTIDKKGATRLSKYIDGELEVGKILGQVTLVDCLEMNDELAKKLAKENSDIYTSHSFSNNYAWQLKDVKKFDELIEVNGKLGLWNYEV